MLFNSIIFFLLGLRRSHRNSVRNCTIHRMLNDYGGTTLQKSCHGPQNHQEKSVQWRNGCSAAHQNDARLSKRHQTKLYFNIHNRRTRRTGQWFIFVFLWFFIVSRNFASVFTQNFLQIWAKTMYCWEHLFLEIIEKPLHTAYYVNFWGSLKVAMTFI